MVEDIITGLSRIKWLFVIARNSSFTYKGKAVDIRQVGRELGVRYVLEGGVRKAGNRLRITAQLDRSRNGRASLGRQVRRRARRRIRPAGPDHREVVGVVEPNLVKAEIERSRRKRPESLDAYDLFLRALPHWRRCCRRRLRRTATMRRRYLRRGARKSTLATPPRCARCLRHLRTLLRDKSPDRFVDAKNSRRHDASACVIAAPQRAGVFAICARYLPFSHRDERGGRRRRRRSRLNASCARAVLRSAAVARNFPRPCRSQATLRRAARDAAESMRSAG